MKIWIIPQFLGLVGENKARELSYRFFVRVANQVLEEKVLQNSEWTDQEVLEYLPKVYSV